MDETRSLKSGESAARASFRGVKSFNIEAAGKISKLPSEESKRPPIPPIRNFAPDEKDLNELFHQSHSEQTSTALVNELANNSVFTPQTITRLVDVFERTAGAQDEELEYNPFLGLVNSRLPAGRQLEDDRVTKRIFSLLDTDGSGGLNVREFVLGLSILCRSKSEEQFKFVFRVFDADDDGLISKGELVSMLRLNTQSIQSEEQASTKADEILRLAGNVDLMTMEGFLRVKDKKLMLVAPVQERARKITYIVNSSDK
jgi:Ca2+-binding EF-hand superfamily protein